MDPKSPSKNSSEITSKSEGQDLSLVTEIWIKTATTECRLNLIRKLIKEKLGFGEVEEYCHALDLQLKSDKLKKQIESTDIDRTIVAEIMGLKLKDADICYREALATQNRARREIHEAYGKNSRKSRRILKIIWQESHKVKTAIEQKYNEKIEHLKKKYTKKKKEAANEEVPVGLENYKEA